jgi:hypothetical protein
MFSPEENAKIARRVAAELGNLVAQTYAKHQQLVRVIEQIDHAGVITYRDWVYILDFQDAYSRYMGYKDALRAAFGDQIVDEVEQNSGYMPKDLPQSYWTAIGNLKKRYGEGRFDH